jgi:hypothetical protein
MQRFEPSVSEFSFQVVLVSYSTLSIADPKKFYYFSESYWQKHQHQYFKEVKPSQEKYESPLQRT